MATFNQSIAFEVSKFGTVDIDLAKLSDEQLLGAIQKGLHEFLKDAHAGKEGDDATAAVQAKLQRLMDGAVPGLGRSGGGKRLDAFERFCREEAEAMFRPKMAKAELAKKAAMEWRETLLAAAVRQHGETTAANEAFQRGVSVIESRAAERQKIAKESEGLDLNFG